MSIRTISSAACTPAVLSHCNNCSLVSHTDGYTERLRQAIINATGEDPYEHASAQALDVSLPSRPNDLTLE